MGDGAEVVSGDCGGIAGDGVRCCGCWRVSDMKGAADVVDPENGFPPRNSEKLSTPDANA